MFYRLFGLLHALAFTAAGHLRPYPRRLRSESGQGTVEYVALIILVAVVLAGVVAATRKTSIGGGEIGTTIVKKIQGALESVK